MPFPDACRAVVTPGLAATAILLGACSHTPPGAPDAPTAQGPYSAAAPIRLTLNPGPDLTPAWAADGRSVWYAFQALDRAGRDICLGLLPAAGGTRQGEACQTLPAASADSFDTYTSPTVRGTRLAWMRLTTPVNGVVPTGGDLVVAPASAPDQVASVRHFPFTSASGRFHSLAASPAWLDDSTLVFAGQFMFVTGNPPRDTALGGQELVLVHLAAGGATTSVVGGTQGASSVAAGTTPGELYYTLDADSRVYRIQLPDTTPLVAYDFGAAGVARDVSVAGPCLLAVVGGQVSDSVYPSGLAQSDAGGTVYLVENGIAGPVSPAGTSWRSPALSPDCRSFVGSAADTTGRPADLYRVDLP
jgi:hypothetical protein